MSPDEPAEILDLPGPLVRPYAITRGRIATAAYDLDLITLVVALRDSVDLADGEPEHEQILHLCQQPRSVAEVAARVGLPITVVKVLLTDLIDHKHVIFRTPPDPAAVQDPRLLKAVLDGIRDI